MARSLFTRPACDGRDRHCRIVALACAAIAALPPLIAQAEDPPKSPPATPGAKSPFENLHRVSPQVFSGGEPHDDAAFSKLAELGVRTVVSVDGAKPDLAAAKKHGLRYIHIPIGYDGVDEQAQASLTRVMRDVKGSIFIHCHHGKHRGPAAAAVMCLAAGQLDHPQALAFLKLAGTGQEYQGLWHDVQTFKPLPAGAKLPELVESAKVDSLAAAMATLDRAWDGVKLCQAAGWTTPSDHADLEPEHEALLVWEALKESRRALDETDQQMMDWMDAAVADAEQLRQTLKPARPDDATKTFKQLEAACARCHEQYRN